MITKTTHRLVYPNKSGNHYTNLVIFTPHEDGITVFVQAYSWSEARACVGAGGWDEEAMLRDPVTGNIHHSGLYGIGAARDIWNNLKLHGGYADAGK